MDLRSHPVGELLKHLDVVRLFGEFVHEVAEFGVLVRQAHQELGTAEKEQLLELGAGLCYRCEPNPGNPPLFLG